jgi:hypothetical protein
MKQVILVIEFMVLALVTSRWVYEAIVTAEPSRIGETLAFMMSLLVLLPFTIVLAKILP